MYLWGSLKNVILPLFSPGSLFTPPQLCNDIYYIALHFFVYICLFYEGRVYISIEACIPSNWFRAWLRARAEWTPICCDWVKSLSRVRLFVTPWMVAYKAPPSMGFSRQEYWSGLPFPSPGDLPNPGIEPGFPALQINALPSESPGKSKEKGNERCFRSVRFMI